MRVEKLDLLVLFFALAISTVALHLSFLNQGFWWDETVYLSLARNIYEGRGYYINLSQESFRAPLFPVLIAEFWKLLGASEALARILPPVFYFLSILLTYFFAKNLLNRRIAFLSATILATTPLFLLHSTRILTESFFVFISLLATYFYFHAVEWKKFSYFAAAGVFIALAFLTRYVAFLLGVTFFLYPILTKKRSEDWIKNIFFWFGIFLGIIILLPWFFTGLANYKNPFGILEHQWRTISSEFYIGPSYFYFEHWLETFGLIGLFVFSGIWFAASKRKPSHIFILLILVVVLIFFSALPRKETRYLISFLPFFATTFALGIDFIRKEFFKPPLLIAIAIIILFNLSSSLQIVYSNLQAGKALKDAGTYLAAIVPSDARILSQNVPQIHYFTRREVVEFPQELSKLDTFLIENKIAFIVIESREPSYPSWTWKFSNGDKMPSEVFNKFTLEKSFEENGKTIVWIYRVD